jgi:hypothetical protein
MDQQGFYHPCHSLMMVGYMVDPLKSIPRGVEE